MPRIAGSGSPRISGEIEIAKISGETVISKISGETVIAKVSGETLIAKISGETVISKISGETITAKVSGETVIAKISGETVRAEVSGDTVRVAVPKSVITGQAMISGTNLSGASPVSIGSAVCVSVIVKAFPTNSGNIYIGNDTVSSNSGFVLAPGETVSIDIDNVNKLYATSDVDGDKVCWMAIQE